MSYTRTGKANSSRRRRRNPTDAPVITQERVGRANLYHGKKLIARGRPPVTKRSRILNEVHETAVAMHRSGAIDKQTMQEFDVLARRPDRPMIAEIRERLARRSSVTPRTSVAEALRRERKKR
jgi:hypothetical protein